MDSIVWVPIEPSIFLKKLTFDYYSYNMCCIQD